MSDTTSNYQLQRYFLVKPDLGRVDRSKIFEKLESLGNKFTEVSKFPPIVRDISFIVDKDFIPNNYFDLVRDVAPDLAEEVTLIDKYENNEKLGESKISYAYRITYRSLNRTLTNEEIDILHKKLEEKTKEVFDAQIR